VRRQLAGGPPAHQPPSRRRSEGDTLVTAAHAHNGNGGSWIMTWILRLLSLFLAFVVWFIVSAPRRERVSERAFAAPVSVVGMRPDLIITTPLPDTVNVRLRGRTSDLRSLSSQNLEVTLDLSWVTPGEAAITLHPQAINVPPQIEVISIDPSRLHFRAEQLRQKVVPIRPFLVGQPPVGFLPGDPTVVPDSALVSGPSSQIRNVSEVATERIIMTGRTSTFVQNVAVVSDSPLIRVIEPATAQVTVPVNAEVGPVAPATETTESTTTTTTTRKP
jgi:YbbR domain-containing protein